MNAWDVLGIEPTQNKREIKKAYAKLIAKFHPEDHPEKFQEIQNAYDYVMNLLNTTDGSNEVYYDTLDESFYDRSNDRDSYNTYIEKDVESNTTNYEKQTSNFNEKSIYDQLDIKWSQSNQQEEKKGINNFAYEDSKVHKDKLVIEDETTIEDLIYKRINERLKYVCDVESLRILISNQGNVNNYV